MTWTLLFFNRKRNKRVRSPRHRMILGGAKTLDFSGALRPGLGLTIAKAPASDSGGGQAHRLRRLRPAASGKQLSESGDLGVALLGRGLAPLLHGSSFRMKSLFVGICMGILTPGAGFRPSEVSWLTLEVGRGVTILNF